MAQRYESIINDAGDFVEVRIYDSEYTGAVSQFTIANDSPVFEYDSKIGDNLFESRIVGSSVEVEVKVAYDDEDLITLFEDIVTSYEGRFVMEVVTEEIGFWRGIIMPDQISIPDSDYSLSKLVATDGLASLKTKKYEYDKDVQNKTPRSFIVHIIEILRLIPFIDDFYDSNDVILSSFTNFRNIAGHTGGVDPVKRSGFFNFFYDIKNGVAEYESAWEVLNQICELWNARLYYKGSDTDGGYKFVSIDTYNDDNGKEWVYKKDYSLRNYKGLNNAPITISNALTDHYTSAGGVYNFLPPLKFIQKNFISERANFNLLRNVTHEGSMTNGGAITNPSSVDIYTIQEQYYSTLRLGAKLDFNINEYVVSLWSPTDLRLHVFLKFKIQIEIDNGTTTYYLNKKNGTADGLAYTHVGSGTNKTVISTDDLEWVTAPVYGIEYYMRFTPRAEVVNVNGYHAFNNIVEFLTPLLPTYGTVTMRVTIPSANFLEPDNLYLPYENNTFSTYSTGRELTWTLTGKSGNSRTSSIVLSSSTDGDINEGAYDQNDTESLPLLVEVDENNTFSIEKSVKFADRIVGRDQYDWASQQQLLITDSDTPSLLDWEVSDALWNYNGVGTGQEIEKLVTERMARMQSLPVRYYSGTINHNSDGGNRVLFDTLINYRGRILMPMQIRWNMHKDTIDGVWAEVHYDSASTVTVNIKDQDKGKRSRDTRRSNQDTNTAYKVGAEAAGNRFAIKPRYKEFTISGSTLDISSDGFVFDSSTHSAELIEANTDIIIRNIIYRYVDSDVGMPQNTWTLTQTTNPNDTITFWRDITGESGYIKEWDHYNY